MKKTVLIMAALAAVLVSCDKTETEIDNQEETIQK